MIETRPRRFGVEIEEEWLRSTDIGALLDSLAAVPVLNVVGASSPALRLRLLDGHPDRRIRAINISSREVIESNVDDVLQASAELLPASMLSHSSTVILDPQIGTWIASQPLMLGDIAARTQESLIMPVFVAPEPYHLFFSEAFSFVEPTDDDSHTDRWCWAVGEGQASVFVQTATPIAGRRLAFTLSSHSPGTYVCHLGNQVHCFATTPDNLTRRVEFRASDDDTISQIAITFDGPTFYPEGALDQRKALRFCFSSFELECPEADQAVMDAVKPPRPFGFIPERCLRRIIHLNGFFEVKTLNSPWTPWANQAGIRSCFDYQAGFALRDIWQSGCGTITNDTARSYIVPAVWVEARRTPSPGSEWISSDERLSALKASWGGGIAN